MNDAKQDSPFRFFKRLYWRDHLDFERELQYLIWRDFDKSKLSDQDIASALRKMADDLDPLKK